jgi:hypothetical protein
MIGPLGQMSAQCSCCGYEPAATREPPGALKRSAQLADRPSPFKKRFAPERRGCGDVVSDFRSSRQRHFDLLFLAILKFQHQLVPPMICGLPARRQTQLRRALLSSLIVTHGRDELDTPVRAIVRERAPGDEPGPRRRDEAVCDL